MQRRGKLKCRTQPSRVNNMLTFFCHNPLPTVCPSSSPRLQLLELASLLHAYGLVSAVPTFAPAGPPAPTVPSGTPLSPDSRRQQHRQRQKAVPKLNPDGSVRLNARQRRTLRRAQERAMKALLEAQTKAHGISSEQVPRVCTGGGMLHPWALPCLGAPAG